MYRPDEERMVSRLRHLTEIETPSGDDEQIRRALALVDSWMPSGRPASVDHVRENVSHRQWPGLSTSGPLVVGHIDTVWARGTIDRLAFGREGDVIRGPGVFDMKAGIVVAVETLTIATHGDDVSMLLTGDEEVGSITSRPLIEQIARSASAVLVPEPSLDGDLKSARRGGSIYTLTFRGRAAHAGLEPDKGRSALVALARSVLELSDLSDPVRGTSVSPTVAQSGTATNVIPDHARLQVDVRAWQLTELQRIDAALRAREGERDGVVVSVAGGINRAPMESSASAALLEIAQDVAAQQGLRVPAGVAAGGASDGNFTAALGVPTLDGLGPLGDGAHAEHEWVSVAGMVERAVLLAGMIDRLIGRGV